MKDKDEVITTLRAEITGLNRCLHAKNIALDAMHWVWCDGGCETGVHRFNSTELTEEMVVAAERNTARLRTWFDNKKWRAMTAIERAVRFKEKYNG